MGDCLAASLGLLSSSVLNWAGWMDLHSKWVTRRVGKKELLKIIDDVIFSFTYNMISTFPLNTIHLKYLASKKVKSLELESHWALTMVVLMVQPS